MTTPHRIISAIIRAVPSVIPHLGAATRAALKAAPGYVGIRASYWLTVYDAVEGYLTGSQSVTTFRNAIKRGIADAFVEAAELAYVEGGADLPMDDETLAWLGGEQEREFGYVDELFSRLKENWEGIDPTAEALARAEGYANHLDGIYSEAKTRAAGNKMLTFGGSDGKESCPECKRMKGKRHRAKWWVDNGMIPGPGNSNYTCNGYNCEHRLFDDDGNEWTV